MNKKTIAIILLTALSLSLVLALGCSKGGNKSGAALYSGARSMAAPMSMADVAYEEAGWEASNYQRPADAAGLDDSTPAAFRDGQASVVNTTSANTTSADTTSADSIPEPVNAERKLVKRADVRIRVESLEAAEASVAELLKKYDAYAASNSIQENSYYYSLRVPAPHYDAFLAEMNGMGRLLRRSESTEDVTLRYYDLEGRLETKKELLRTFQSYLGRAKTIEEILAVEARISELQYDIEGTGIQFRNLANRVDYATVELNLLGPAAATPSQTVTFGEQLKQMFGGFGDFLASTAVVIVGIVIYGIPILLLVVFFFWLLFGRLGLLKKLWRLVRGKKQDTR